MKLVSRKVERSCGNQEISRYGFFSPLIADVQADFSPRSAHAGIWQITCQGLDLNDLRRTGKTNEDQENEHLILHSGPVVLSTRP